MKKILLICAILLSGCATTASVFNPIPIASSVINTYVVWRDGEASAYYPFNANIMHKATLRALKKLDIPIKEDKSNKEGYKIIAASRDKFNISIKSTEKKVSEVSIRINFLGNKSYTKLIYKTIEEQLSVVEF